MAEQALGGRGQNRHQDQVSSDGDRVEHCTRDESQEGSNDTSKDWSGESTGELEGSAKEEEAMSVGGAEWGR